MFFTSNNNLFAHFLFPPLPVSTSLNSDSLNSDSLNSDTVPFLSLPFSSSLFTFSLDADRATIWLLDKDTNELWSKVADGVPLIRIPKETGVVGWVVKNGQMLNVPDAYVDDRFNPSVDKSTGYKTMSILCCPVHNEDGVTIGAVQVINKKSYHDDGDTFTLHGTFHDEDEIIIESLCQHLRLAFETCGGIRNNDGSQTNNNSTVAENETLSLSTEALLRFELKHRATGNANSPGRMSLMNDGTRISDDGSISDSSYTGGSISMDGGGNGSSQALMSDNVRVDVQGNASHEDDEMSILHPRRRCRCCCLYIPCCRCCSSAIDSLHEWSGSQILHLTKKPIVYFTKDDAPEELNTAIRYMLSNEQRRWIKFVRVFPNEESLPTEIPGVYTFLEYAYPEILIEYTAMIGEFGPPAIRALSYHTHVPTTFMFMGSFGENFNFSFTELGGLRLITDNFVSTVAPTEISVNKVNKKHLLETQIISAGNGGGGGGGGDGGRGDNNDGDEDDDIIIAPRSSSWAEGSGENKDKRVSTLTRKEAQAFAMELANR